MTELRWEQMAMQAEQARRRLLCAVAREPELLTLWQRWQQAERALLDAGRARRAAETVEAS